MCEPYLFLQSCDLDRKPPIITRRTGWHDLHFLLSVFFYSSINSELLMLTLLLRYLLIQYSYNNFRWMKEFAASIAYLVSAHYLQFCLLKWPFNWKCASSEEKMLLKLGNLSGISSAHCSFLAWSLGFNVCTIWFFVRT